MYKTTSNLIKPLLLAGLLCFSQGLSAAGTAIVAAASDLQFALEEVAQQFTKETGLTVKFSFGSSGNFARQIMQGAPYGLFMSADEKYVSELAKQHLTVDEGRLYGIGRLVLYAPKGSSLKVDSEMQGLVQALKNGQIKRFAIANPEHAPYGRAAKAALISVGLWDSIQPHLVLGENVAQAAQFAMSDSTQGGIFAYSFALSPKIKAQGNYVLLPENSHPPLRQKMVLTKKADATAKAFYTYLQAPKAKDIFRRYGFAVPQ
ncbi:molybdate ABC transporter substrate-binding protein [Methyloglobulus sp.]|uniref:molybdate ABC transporter substrate-binding protein n=1 Tax=Methyloglobulus sp. TaxID=2518622 RepID=UPI0039893038